MAGSAAHNGIAYGAGAPRMKSKRASSSGGGGRKKRSSGRECSALGVSFRGRWFITAAALAFTAFAVVTLRGPCQLADSVSKLPQQRTDSAGGAENAAGGLAAAAAVAAVAAADGPTDWAHLEPLGAPTLAFDFSCGSFAEQRLALAYAAAAARRANRTLVLPTLITGGADKALDPVLFMGEEITTAPLEALYDGPALAAALAGAGVTAVTSAGFHDMAGDDVVPLKLTLPERPAGAGAAPFPVPASVRHVAVDCPLFKLPPAAVRAEADVFWRALGALQPTVDTRRSVVDRTVKAGGAAFNFLHLAVGREWQRQCFRFAKAAAGVAAPDNCVSNTQSVGASLEAMGVPKGVPLYVAAEWGANDAKLEAAALASLAAHGYPVVKSPPPGESGLPRESSALVDYELALLAEKFVGNTAHPFGALALLERRHARKWAASYNGGAAPLDVAAPLLGAPWVFTFDSWSAPMEPLLKAAVNSAARVGHVLPHCLFVGDDAAPIAAWLRDHGVRLIRHSPEWAGGALHSALERWGARAPSHEAALSALARIDVPVAAELAQYPYVLYTDVDVYFRRRFSMDDLPRPLPPVIGLGAEMRNQPPWSVGVMVLAVAPLHASHSAFVAHVMAATALMTNQDAYNGFYAKEAEQWRLPARFNAKPYHNHAPRNLSDVAIVHFHGPKPGDYAAFAAGRPCGAYSGDLCRAGLGGRACHYLAEWLAHVETEDAPSYKPAIGAACEGKKAAGG